MLVEYAAVIERVGADCARLVRPSANRAALDHRDCKPLLDKMGGGEQASDARTQNDDMWFDIGTSKC